MKIANWHDLNAVEKMKECTDTFCAEEMIIGNNFIVTINVDGWEISKADCVVVLGDEMIDILNRIHKEYFVEDKNCRELKLYGKVCIIKGTYKIYFTDVMYVYDGETYWLSPKLKINFIKRNKAMHFFVEPFTIDDFDTIYNMDLSNQISECDDELVHGIIIKPYDLVVMEDNKPLYIEKRIV